MKWLAFLLLFPSTCSAEAMQLIVQGTNSSGNEFTGYGTCFVVGTTETGKCLIVTARHNLDNADLLTLFEWAEETFERNTQGSPIRRIGYQRWLRNLSVGLGNAPASLDIMAALTKQLDNPSALVREHVQWALNEQQRQHSSTQLWPTEGVKGE